MLNPKFAELLKKLTTPTTIKLSHTTELPLVKDENLRIFLDKLYNSSNITFKLTATLINGITTHQMRTFMFSKRIMDGLICSDPNTEAVSCQSSNYRDFMHKCLGDNIITTLRSHGGGRAGIYKLQDPATLDVLYKLHSEDYFKAQEDAALDFYDNYKINNNNLDSLSIPEINQMLKKGDLKVKK